MVAPFTLIRVIDTETTGIDDPAEICEIGWTDVRLFPDGWQIESGPHSSLVNPGMPITFGAMAVHHIRQAEAERGIDPDEARRMVATGADILCAHNVTFDSRFIPDHTQKWICTLKAARTIWPDLQGHSNGSIRYELDLVPHDDPRAMPSHRAGPDTWVTAHILLKMLETHSVEQLVEISENPIRLLKMPFGKHYGVPFSNIDGSYLDWLVNKSDMASDPAKEDVIYTARMEIARRRSGRAA